MKKTYRVIRDATAVVEVEAPSYEEALARSGARSEALQEALKELLLLRGSKFPNIVSATVSTNNVISGPIGHPYH